MTLLIVTTALTFAASIFDEWSTEVGIREGRIREGNALLRGRVGVRGKVKYLATGAAVGAGWLVHFAGWPDLATGLLLALAVIFLGLGLFAWRTKR